MRRIEHYHEASSYSDSGIAPYCRHVQEYFAGTRTIPVSRVASLVSPYAYFTFTDDMLRRFLTEKDRMKKPYECAVKYGYRGNSRGGRNGIFNLRKADRNLASVIASLASRNSSQIVADLDCLPSAIPDLRSVKIVYHDPSGERVVGLLNERNGRIIFLGFAKYK